MKVESLTDAKKERRGRAEALALAKSAKVIHVAKGKKLVSVDMKDAPDDDTLASLLLGPSGNLRAPAIKKGSTLYIGFSEQAYLEMVK